MKKESEERKKNLLPSKATFVSEGATYERNIVKGKDHFTRMLECIEKVYILHGFDNKARDEHVKELKKEFETAFGGFLQIKGMGNQVGHWSSYNTLLRNWWNQLEKEANKRDPLLSDNDKFAEALIQQYKEYKNNKTSDFNKDRSLLAQGLGKQNIDKTDTHNFSNQPKEIILEILTFLDTKSLAHMGQVSKTMNDHSKNNNVWDEIRKRHENSETTANKEKFTKKEKEERDNQTVVKDAYKEIKVEEDKENEANAPLRRPHGYGNGSFGVS